MTTVNLTAAKLQGNITASLAIFGDRDGTYVTACYQHEESCRDFDYYGVIIDDQTDNSTFFNWYSGGAVVNSRRYDGPWKSDATCAPQGVKHGGC
jgi:hypothetical protein